MLYLVEQYKAAHLDEGSEVYPDRVAKWAMHEGLWKRPPLDPEEILRRQIRRALRDDYIFDPQGREVRANHPVMEEFKTGEGLKLRSTWYPLFEMPPQKARSSFQLRRRAALMDVHQLDLDFNSYNDNNIFGEVLDRPDYDFNKDIEEMAHSTRYDEGATPTLDDEVEDI